ncbi:peptidoglycan-associated lipoprotein [Nitrosomonas cryotolerans]|uniref:Peptidoglycan-associated lipoprotein n=1 Tax=Nitrosomonas cryotolerans ATCC 49181 TaxID=1131553 RepID=A0A1N6G6R7_9PROT|nr:peptidoglycan-associated lipoprotein Pal [Nitrosomonas cryotolerans]SFP51784.1 peptidoglycan-associated lipoprotein [Nitrosomonas cryotolerans]SIO03236.1 peptidoglycan-associated lipoprotein [Nitrosomonas cryotolerans ATCC 49181]
MRRALSILMLGLLSACASQTTTPVSEVEDRSFGTSDSSGIGERNGIGSDRMDFHPLQDPNSILSKRSVYYDYDSYTVKNEYRELVLAHARYLRDNTNARLLLQGNTDERGSREYNLALGQRRADSVKNMMTLSGARNTQIESVSLGEEKPRSTGHDEASQRENRRTDIIYRGE